LNTAVEVVVVEVTAEEEEEALEVVEVMVVEALEVVEDEAGEEGEDEAGQEVGVVVEVGATGLAILGCSTTACGTLGGTGCPPVTTPRSSPIRTTGYHPTLPKIGATCLLPRQVSKGTPRFQDSRQVDRQSIKVTWPSPDSM
jgi:hypothetical protein